MIHDFAIVWDHRDRFLDGFVNTVWMCIAASIGALVLGAVLAIILMARRRWLAKSAQALVDAMRCVPFLLFAYVIYYGLPSLGIRLDNWTTGVAALTLYNSAYMAELLRAAWTGLPRDMIEAGQAFGFVGFGLFRRIILWPVVFAATPIFGNQMIQIIKDSAFLTIIAVPELTHEASSVQSTYYIPFAAFIAAVLLYWSLCMVVEMGVLAIGRVADVRR
ncbi:MAG TPA: amino acid ABC transporter permease [Stellaceae bacterium]|jgi:polar amino acid transport system permease protein